MVDGLMDHWRVKMTSAKGIDLMCCDPPDFADLECRYRFQYPLQSHTALNLLNVE